MTASRSEPSISVVIVTLSGLDDLSFPLPGLLSQTIAAQIELIVVAPEGVIAQEDIVRLEGLHSVQLVEQPKITNRGIDAAAGVVVASAPFVALHENHTRSEPQTYERLLEAFEPQDAVLAPVLYPANGEMPWGQAMYALAHSHAAPPNDSDPKQHLVFHSGVYRTELLIPFGDKLEHEGKVQAELTAAGHRLRYVPGTVVWHLNESRARRVRSDTFALGRAFGHARAAKMSMPERVGRSLLLPVVASINMLRVTSDARRNAASHRDFLVTAPRAAFAGLCFGTGEIVGYFDRQSAWGPDNELHEFHVRGRLGGRSPVTHWVADAITALPDGAP